jgi:hypothetical protein
VRTAIALLFVAVGVVGSASAEEPPSEDTKGAVELLAESLKCAVPTRTENEYTTITRHQFERSFEQLKILTRFKRSAISEIELYEVEISERIAAPYAKLSRAEANGVKVVITCAGSAGSCIRIHERDPLMDCGGDVEVCEIDRKASTTSIELCDAETASNVSAAIRHLIEVNGP